MSKKTSMKPLAVAMGAAFVTTLGAAQVANAASNPFAMTELSSGYMVADNHAAEGKCGSMKAEEAKCGGKKTEEGKCGAGKSDDGKCGMMNKLDTNGDGSVSKEEFMAGHAAMFDKKDANGDGKIDASEMMKGHEGKCGEGKCGEKRKMHEGKCGEGKCGAGMMK